ncbi:MAG: hypothetical protein MUO54_17075 [Anaerolineales bacterium]|nr:hypothetical protein [Anaerolineales bacterium]
MLKNKRQYINLVDGTKIKSSSGEFTVIPQSRVVQLSGPRWGWVWNQPSGLKIRKGEREQMIPVVNFTRIIMIVMYGVSVLLVVLGLLKPRRIQRGA